MVKSHIQIIGALSSFLLPGLIHAQHFIADTTSGCAPLVVNFSSLAPEAITWEWDFGNGITSRFENPGVIYGKHGKYTIRLTVGYPDGTTETFLHTNFITVSEVPELGFNIDTAQVCLGQAIHIEGFTETNSLGTIDWIWDFGDGNTGEGKAISHTYSQSGVYSLTAIGKSIGNCQQVKTFPNAVQVFETPNAAFDFTNGFACDAPALVQFNAATGQGLHQWEFGDNEKSTEAHPLHSFEHHGTYNISHIISNDLGCSDTMVLEEAITLGESYLKIFHRPTPICVGSPVIFYSTAQQAKAYSWDIGNGLAKGHTDSLVHTFQDAGTFPISLLVEDDKGCISNFETILEVFPAVTAAFTTLDTFSCSPPLDVSFENLSTGATTYYWGFGSEGASQSKHPTYTFDEAGSFDIHLIASNSYGCSDSVTVPNGIHISTPLVEFQADKEEFCIPQTVDFTDLSNSMGTIVEWHWEFGNGQSAALPNPSIQYTDTGKYSVSLFVQDHLGCNNTLTKTHYIKAGEQVNASFEIDTPNSCMSELLGFQHTSTGRYTQCLWDFGDGTTSSLCQPNHTYSDTGYFDVSLMVENNGCKDTLVKPKALYISPPLAQFQVSNDTLCSQPARLQFTNTSVGADKWSWDFGDGVNSTQENPDHTFQSSGIASVQLVASNTLTACTDTFNLPIHILPALAKFKVNQKKGCYPLPVRFTDQSPDAVSWHWDFGDGNTSNKQHPIHTYHSPGEFDVRLVITNSLGCKDTLVQTKLIQSLGTHIYFTTSDTKGCAPFSTHFEAVVQSSSSIRDLTWELGDGTLIKDSLQIFHTYLTAGNFDVKLEVRNEEGCSNASHLQNLIQVAKPRADFTAEFPENCPGNPIQFNNLSEGENLLANWNMGNGFATNAFSPEVTYSDTGKYSVSLYIKDGLGCTSNITKSNFVHIKKFEAGFTSDTSFGACPPLLAHFSVDPKIEHLSTWSWDFGDGQGSNKAFASHVYASPGTYDVSLSITHENGCQSSSTQENFITLLGPSVEVHISPLHACPGEAINFSATAKDVASFQWETGDGKLMIGKSFQYSYSEGGVYFPNILVHDGKNCQYLAPIHDSVRIDLLPIAEFSTDKPLSCDGDTLQFTNHTEPLSPLMQWQWDFGDGNQSFTQNPRHSYEAIGNYPVRMIARTQAGCSDTSATYILANVSSPHARIQEVDSIACAPFSSTFKDISRTAAPIRNWEWKLEGGLASSTEDSLRYVFQDPGNYTLSLRVQDEHGCEDTDTVKIEVFPRPNVQFEASDSLGCAPTEIHFSMSDESEIKTWAWDFGNGQVSNISNPTVQYLSDGLYTISLLLDHENGCNSVISKANYIQLSHPNAEFRLSDTVTCPYSPFQVFDQSTGIHNIYSWNWDFGDGATGNGPQSLHVYTEPGYKNIRLIIEDSLGCRDTLIKERAIFVQDDVEPPTPLIHSVNVRQHNFIEVSFSKYKGNDFYAYEISRELISGTIIPIDTIFTLNDTVYQDKNIDPNNQSQCYTLRLINTCGNVSAYSQQHCSLRATSFGVEDAIHVNWEPYTAGPSPVNYKVYKQNEEGLFHLIHSTSSTSFIDTQMFCYDFASYRIQAISTDGMWKVWSNITRSQPLHFSPKDSVHMVKASIQPGGEVAVLWESPELSYGARYVVIERWEDGEYKKIAQIPARQSQQLFIDTEGNTQQKWYAYRAYVRDSCGDFTHIGEEINTMLLQVEKGINHNRLWWNPYTKGQVSYEVQVAAHPQGNFQAIGKEIAGRTFIHKNLYFEEQVCYRLTTQWKGHIAYSNTVCVQMEPMVHVPSAFSPNHDGVNDLLIIQTRYIKNFTLNIFNRWGKKVFESLDPGLPWDGTWKNGKAAPAGVYTYQLQYLDILGRKERILGTISLIR